jgi:chromosome segregation protein
MQQTLASVKSEANAKLKALQADLGTVQASEERMRKELAAKPAVAETAGAFEQQVKATLEAEAAAGRVAEAEERLAAAEARHKELKVEVDMLQAHRAAAVSAMAPKDGSLSEQGVEELLKKVSQAAKRLETLENRREALKDDVDRFGALAEARRADAAAARRDATLAQAETAEAASDASAARTQTKEIEAQLVDARAELERVSAEVAAAQTDKEVATSARRGAVSGAEPPRRALHAFEDTPLARVAALSRVAVGTPSPLAFDCPVDIGVTGPADQAGQAMVDAVLADLQVFFNNSIAESAQRAQPMAA